MRQHTRKLTSLGLAIAAALSLAACGKQSDAQFNASFDKSTHDSCVPSATQHGATPENAEKYCTCVVAELDKLSVQDKMSLPLHQEKLQAAANTCNAQIGAQ